MDARAYIISRLLPEWVDQFLLKAEDYNDNQNENHRVLGVKGQFADIWRKIGKLKKALWHDEPLVGEQPREILMDLVAHCLLTIELMDREEANAEASRREGKPCCKLQEGHSFSGACRFSGQGVGDRLIHRNVELRRGPG